MVERIVVAMSGGVDSSVAAALVLEQGFDVIGVTLRLLSCSDPSTLGSCCSPDAVDAARDVAGHLGIPHYVIDYRREFEDSVLRPAWSEYQRGRTPNPCIRCNELVKFGLLARKARGLGATRIATGHYARLVQGSRNVYLLRGLDKRKDQSYVLFSLSRGQREGVLLPLGELTKDEVRRMARELDLPTADSAESQDACLRDDELGFAGALRSRVGTRSPKGEIVDTEGKVLGRHDGIHGFTIGQRKRLGLSLGARAWVVAIDAERGRVIVSTDQLNLLSEGLCATGFAWYIEPPHTDVRGHTQLGAHLEPVPAIVRPGPGGSVVVRFEAPQCAVTPGQAAVLYWGDRIIGGGWIEHSIPLREQTTPSEEREREAEPSIEPASGSRG